MCVYSQPLFFAKFLLSSSGRWLERHCCDINSLCHRRCHCAQMISGSVKTLQFSCCCFSFKVSNGCSRISAAGEGKKKTAANLFKGNCQLYIKVLRCVLCSFATYARERSRKCSVETFAPLQRAVQIQINWCHWRPFFSAFPFLSHV